jgi:hypothetical protein
VDIIIKGEKMKVVINTCYGGFSISEKAAQYMAARGSVRAKGDLEPRQWGFTGYGYVEGMEGGYDRSDPLLVEAVETLGGEADGRSAELKVVEIPDGIQWEIDDYDGVEHINEVHREWY